MYIWWAERDSNPQCLPCGNGFTVRRNTTNRCRPPTIGYIYSLTFVFVFRRISNSCVVIFFYYPINFFIVFYIHPIPPVGIEYNGAPCENRTHIRRLQVARFTIKLTGHVSWSMWQDSNLRITVLQTVPLDHLGTHANYCLHFIKISKYFI